MSESRIELETNTLTQELDLLIITRACRWGTDLFRYPIKFLVPLDRQILWVYKYDQ